MVYLAPSAQSLTIGRNEDDVKRTLVTIQREGFADELIWFQLDAGVLEVFGEPLAGALKQCLFGRKWNLQPRLPNGSFKHARCTRRSDAPYKTRSHLLEDQEP